MSHIVTRDSLQNLLNRGDEVAMHTVGRALVVLFNKQTESEKTSNTTNVYNNVGFTAADGYSGALTAKSYIKHRKLADWQVSKWTAKQKNGYSRLTKYWAQLDVAAKLKAQKRA